ncbi:MAG: SDR family oxidoreductase [Gammaproteobacteria bacterium]
MATVLITGANRGVGLELVKQYAASGDRVLACCRNPAAANALKQVTGDVEIIELQVTEAASVAALAAKLDGQAIDILINNAGTLGPDYPDQTAYTMDFNGFAETLAVNTIAPVRMMQTLLPNLRASSDPKVVNITSQMGAIGLDMTMGFAYCSSKAALNKFMKLAAIELGKEGINVCLIHPGWVKTDMGGPQADITPVESAKGIANTIKKLNADTNGSFWQWDGDVHVW